MFGGASNHLRHLLRPSSHSRPTHLSQNHPGYSFSHAPHFLIRSPSLLDLLSEREPRGNRHTLVSKGNQFIEELLYGASHFRAAGSVSENHPSAPVTPTSVHTYQGERGNLPLRIARVFVELLSCPRANGKIFAARLWFGLLALHASCERPLLVRCSYEIDMSIKLHICRHVNVCMYVCVCVLACVRARVYV